MLLAILLAQAAAPAATAEPIANNHYRLTLPIAAATTVHDGQTRLLAIAGKLCADRVPIFGAYRISAGKADSAKLNLEQELVCFSPADAPPPVEGQPDPLRQQAALATSYAYLAAKDSGRYADAYAVVSDRLREQAPFAQWSAKAEQFAEVAGAPRGRRVTELTWYDNPPDAPEPGRYVAADFSAEFADLEFACGYLMWHVESDGSFRLVREEQNFIDKKKRGIPSLDRAPLRARMGCKD